MCERISCSNSFSALASAQKQASLYTPIQALPQWFWHTGVIFLPLFKLSVLLVSEYNQHSAEPITRGRKPWTALTCSAVRDLIGFLLSKVSMGRAVQGSHSLHSRCNSSSAQRFISSHISFKSFPQFTFLPRWCEKWTNLSTCDRLTQKWHLPEQQVLMLQGMRT